MQEDKNEKKMFVLNEVLSFIVSIKKTHEFGLTFSLFNFSLHLKYFIYYFIIYIILFNLLIKKILKSH